MDQTDARRGNAVRGSLALLLLLLAFATAAVSHAQEPNPVPFEAGEVLSYRAISGRFGLFGSGTMRVDGPVEVRGQQAMQLSFEFRGRLGIFPIRDHTRSWIAIEKLSSLRYARNEQSPLGSRTEEVEIFPEAGRWENARGESGETDCEHPLDELSFLYFLRSLPLNEGAEYTLTHHFDPVRNPVSLRVLRREVTEVPAGAFETVVVEMRVRDDRVSAVRLYLTDDASRIPVRIDSSAPWVGSTQLLLESVRGVAIATR